MRDNHIITTAYDGKLRIWDCDEGEMKHECDKHGSGIYKMCQNEDYIASYADVAGEILIRDKEKFETVGRIDKFQGGLQQRKASELKGNYAMGSFCMTDENVLITGETKKI